MKKLLIFIILLLILSLCGCECQHKWSEPDCENPMICSLCGETEGKAIGHLWQAANCNMPETCSICSKQKGNPLGHKWQPATCEADEICENCGKTQTPAFGHTYLNWEYAENTFFHLCQTCGNKEALSPEKFFIQQMTGIWQAYIYMNGGAEYLEPEHYLTIHSDGTAELILNPKLFYPKTSQLIIKDFSYVEYAKWNGYRIEFYIKNDIWWEEEMGPDVPIELGPMLIAEYNFNQENLMPIELLYPGYNDIWVFKDKIEE